MQRAEVAALRPFGIGQRGLSQRGLAVERDHGVNRAVEARDARQRGFDEADGGQLAFA